jgi:RNA polymerase sigma-70 factor, ECF subfamily
VHEHDWLAQRFEANRTHLRAVAYRMLGSISEADDALQEAWLRLSRSDTSEVENLGGWMRRVVARVCLDMLRSRRSRREEPLGARFSDPIVGRQGGIDPEHEALLADSVGLALLVVLETLSPAERVAFVLHDMFSVCPSRRSLPSWAAPRTRPRCSRAVRAAGYGERTWFPRPISPASEKSVDAFLAASRGGDFDALVAVLDPDVVLRADRSSAPSRPQQPWMRVHRRRSAVRQPWPTPSRDVLGSHNRRS